MRTTEASRPSRAWRRVRWKARRSRRKARLRLRAAARAFDPVGKATLALSPILLLGWLAAASSPSEAGAGVSDRRGSELPITRGQRSLELYREVRLEAAREWAAAFGIPLELAHAIQEAALEEGLEPRLAFRLVRVESSFRRRAVGPRGSVGYTQVRPSTARWLDPSVTRDRLFETETNLRLGFRYLRMLLAEYDDDTRLALLAYNRGPGTVAALLALGQDPGNGYAARVLGRPVAGAEPPGGDAASDEAAVVPPADGPPSPGGPAEASSPNRGDEDP